MSENQNRIGHLLGRGESNRTYDPRLLILVQGVTDQAGVAEEDILRVAITRQCRRIEDSIVTLMKADIRGLACSEFISLGHMVKESLADLGEDIDEWILSFELRLDGRSS